jgi:hypothetical protein
VFGHDDDDKQQRTEQLERGAVEHIMRARAHSMV